MNGESSLAGAVAAGAGTSRRDEPCGVGPAESAVQRRTRGVSRTPFPRVVALSPRELGSWAWVASPAVTVGMAAGPCFAYAAARQRSRALALAAAAYGVASAVIVWNNIVKPGSLLGLDAGVFAVLTLWTVSTVHALAVRGRVFFSPAEVEAVVAAKERIQRRDESRRIAATDPRLARELGIGRPDQPSGYDDGGLLDVNHVSGECLRETGGLNAKLVRRIIEARRHVARFDGIHDLELLAGLDPGSLDDVADRLIFCR